MKEPIQVYDIICIIYVYTHIYYILRHIVDNNLIAEQRFYDKPM